MSPPLADSDAQKALRRLAGERYELLFELGQGGMATVFQAKDHKLKRSVAIKVLHHHLIRDPEHCARFRREAEAIAGLNHPGIVEIYDTLEEPGEFLAIVMKPIEGPSLKTLLDKHAPLLPEVATWLVLPLLSALQQAHGQNIVHRDIKPSNVLVDLSQAMSVLTDFGIARHDDDQSLTATGSLLGSPAYMAPEIIEGQRATPRSDLFSVGALLYLMVCGEPPFTGESPSKLLRNIVNGAHQRADLVCPAVGRPFADILETLLQVDPALRYPSCDALSSTLLNFQKESGIAPDLTAWLADPTTISKQTEELLVKSLRSRAAQAVEARRRFEALNHVERLMALRPDDPEARQLLDRLQNWSSPLPRRLAVIVTASLLLAIFLFLVFLPGEPLTENDTAPTSNLNPLLEETAQNKASATPEAAEATDAPAGETERGTEAETSAEPAIETSAETSAETETGTETGTSVATRTASPSERAPAAALVPATPEEPEPQTETLRFRLIPASAILTIDGRRYDAFQAAAGIDLPHGAYEILVQSDCCLPHFESLLVDAEPDELHRVVLHYKDGYIRLHVDRPALLWLDDEASPRRLAAGSEERIAVAFGRADQADPEREVLLRLAPQDDLGRLQRRTLTLRPATETSLAVSFDGQ